MIEMSEIDFLIIGAAKSATTWLQQCLQQEGHICMPSPELHYFSRHHALGDDWYLSQFDREPHHRLVGEKSNSYLDEPQACGRIRAALPHARLIAQLRNPVDRAYSDYCMLYRRGEVGRDIEHYLDPRHGHGRRFLINGFYHDQLRAYRDAFPQEQLLVLFFEDMRRDAQRQLDIVGDFLRLDGGLHLAPLEGKVKDKTVPMVGPRLRQILKPLKPVVAPLRKYRGFQAARSLIARELDYVPLSRDMRDRLTEYYAPEVERLGKLLGRDLTAWLQGSKTT